MHLCNPTQIKIYKISNTQNPLCALSQQTPAEVITILISVFIDQFCF